MRSRQQTQHVNAHAHCSSSNAQESCVPIQSPHLAQRSQPLGTHLGAPLLGVSPGAGEGGS